MNDLEQAVDPSTPEAGTETPEVKTPDVEAKADTAPESEQAQEKDPIKSLQKRVDTLTRHRYEAKGREESYKQQLSELQAQLNQGQHPPSDDSPPDAKEIERRVETLAERKLSEKTFNDRCNEVFRQGIKEFPDFKEAVESLQLAGVATNDFLGVLIEAKTPAKVLKYLSENIEEAEDIAALPAVKAAMKVADIQRALDAAPVVSKVSKPLSPVGGRANTNPSLESSDFADYEAMRLKQKPSWARF